MPTRYLHIELGADGYTLDFKILDTPLADLWLERMSHRDQYAIDHPDRFYGFGSQISEIKRAEEMTRSCINVINNHKRIIERPFSSARDQDCLNYLHSIFEQYHGLLDQQQHEFWLSAPDPVKKALADLNLAVHRCETAVAPPQPRLVCTWFGLPKTMTLSQSVMSKYGVLNPRFGTVCLNYCEIGKTLEELARDNDQYISDAAFQPFGKYSADFVVRLFEQDPSEIEHNLNRMMEYFTQHRSFFRDRRFLQFNHAKLLPLRFPVAVLMDQNREQILNNVAARQIVTKVWIDETVHHTIA